jgi:hypothetical protein
MFGETRQLATPAGIDGKMWRNFYFMKPGRAYWGTLDFLNEARARARCQEFLEETRAYHQSGGRDPCLMGCGTAVSYGDFITGIQMIWTPPR